MEFGAEQISAIRESSCFIAFTNRIYWRGLENSIGLASVYMANRRIHVGFNLNWSVRLQLSSFRWIAPLLHRSPFWHHLVLQSGIRCCFCNLNNGTCAEHLFRHIFQLNVTQSLPATPYTVYQLPLVILLSWKINLQLVHHTHFRFLFYFFLLSSSSKRDI